MRIVEGGGRSPYLFALLGLLSAAGEMVFHVNITLEEIIEVIRIETVVAEQRQETRILEAWIPSVVAAWEAEIVTAREQRVESVIRSVSVEAEWV